jgi:small subunit ribosomal protein S2
LTNFRTVRSRLTRLEQVEKIRAGEELATYSKKMQSSLSREYRKRYRNLNGIRTLNRMPECLVIVDPNKEKNAVKEARSLGITTVSLIDTDCDPDQVDLPIPGNDDGIRSVELIMRHLAEAILIGSQAAAAAKGKDKDAKAAPQQNEAVAAAAAKDGNA